MGYSRSLDVFTPLAESHVQGFLGRGVHTLGLLRWILEQTGKADVYVSTFSTSDDFLSGFFRLKKEGLIGESFLLADLKAAGKTLQLANLMKNCFTKVCLAPNHSKIVLVSNESHKVTVISSQNQTYGDRHESTVIMTDSIIFDTFYRQFMNIIDKSVNIDAILERHQSVNRSAEDNN